MSFYRPITSALEATGCLGSLVNSLIGTRNSLKCIVEDGEAAFIQDVNLLLQHLHIEHPVGQYVANACHSYSQRIGTGTKTLLMFISLLTKAAAGLQYQGIPLSVSLPIMQTCLDACVEHLKELLIPIRFKFHPQKTESSREGHRQEITCSEPCSQKEQVLFPEKDWSTDKDIFDIENYYFKTDTQRVDSVNKICSCFERKSDCDKCLKLSSEEDNNCIFMSTGTVLDRKTNGNHDKRQFIDIETSYDKTSEYSDISDFFGNIPVEPTKQEMKGLDKFRSQPEDKGNMEDQDEPIIQLQMRGIPANVNDDDDISWFFESGGVEPVQELNTEKAFLQNLLKTHFSISHFDIIDKVEKRGDGIGKANVSKKNIKDVTVTSGSAGTSSPDDTRFSDRVTRCKRNSDSNDSDSEFEQCFDDMLLARKEIVDPLNSFDRNKEIDGCSASLEKAGDLDSEFEQCVDDMLLARREIVDPLNSFDRNKEIDGCSASLEKAGDLDSEFEQCVDDMLLARREIVDPLNSFDRNKEIDGCSASLEKAGDLDSEFEQCVDDMLLARREIVDPLNSFDRNKEIDGCSASLEKAGDLDSEFEQCVDDMLLARREIVDPLNSFDRNKEIDGCSASLEKAGDLDSEFEQCVDDMLLARREIVDPLNSFDRNKEIDGCSASLEKAGDLDSEFEQCVDDMLLARREIVDPLNSFDRNKEIDGCSATLEKAGDLYHLQIDKEKENIDFKETVVCTNRSIQMCKMQRCFGAEKRSAVFDGHNIFDSDKPAYLIGHTLDDISHKHEDEFDVCFEFDQAHFPSTMPVSHSKDPLALSVSKDKASFNFEDKILPGKIKESLKGVQAMLDELKVMPKGGISKHDSKGHVSLSRLQNSSRHFKTVDSSLKTKTGQIYSDKLSVQTKTNLECSKCTHLDTCTTKSLGCYDSNSNDFGNSGPEMILFERFESSGNNKLETDFSHSIRCFKTSDDKNIHRTKPKLVLHSRHLNHVDHKAEEKSHQRQEFTISKAIGKNRDKITSDICLVSEVGFLQEFKNQINTENTPSGLEGNKSILFDSKMNNKENDGEVKNVEFVNERDHSSLRLISQKKVKISANARIDSLLQEGENNACGERFESESYLTETLFPAVHSLVSRLGHTNDKDIIEVISRAIVQQSTLPTDSITSRFDVKKVYCHTMQNSLKQTTALVDGLLLGVSTDQMILISQIRNKPCRALMVNGTVSPTFQHIGHKTSMQGPVITHTTETTPTNQWIQDVRDILQQLRIDVILSKGPVCEEVILLALELHLVVIENVPYKALQALSVATEKEMAVYVDMAAEVNVCQVDSLSPWRSDWMDYGKAMVNSQYIIISVDRNILQTAVISQPCQGLADIKEQEFWQCASRVASSLHFGCVIPGGGRAEEHAMKFCQEQSENTRILNEEKSLFQSVIWEAMAIAFNEFVSTVKMNSQQSTFNEQVPKEDIVSGSLLELDAFDNQNLEVLDDYASKIAAWQTALEIASNILQLDMYIVTGITGMTKSNLVVL